jgi:Na+-driven multidrug efflux pump
VFGFGVITSSVMRSSGMVIAPTAVGIACIIAVELPAAWLMSGWWGLKGVWLAYPVTFCTMWLGYGLLYHYVWRQRDIRRLV